MTRLHKTCTKCGEEKPLDGFHKNRTTKDGHVPQCKECVKNSYRRYRAENRDKIRDRKSRYYAENRDNILGYHARYRAENRDYLAAIERDRTAVDRMLSVSLATVSPGTRFRPEEDALLLESNGMNIYQKAIQLGRTYSSCGSRIKKLRSRVPNE